MLTNLSLWFAAHVFFSQIMRIDTFLLHTILPDLTSLRVLPALLAAWLLLMRHWSLPLVLALAAIASAGFALV